jgi:hypothetical protein
MFTKLRDSIAGVRAGRLFDGFEETKKGFVSGLSDR